NLETVLDKLREDIKDPDFIPNMIRSQLLGNKHRVRLTMNPDTQLDTKRNAEEAARLATIKAGLSQSEQQHIVELSKKLEQRQNQEDDESILPKVGLEDVPDKLDIATGKQTQIKHRTANIYNQATNGLIYQQYVVELPNLDDELLQLLPYYTNCLTELGCDDQDYLTMQARQSSVSGGIGSYTSMRGAIDNEQNVSSHFVLSGKALARNHQDFGELFHDIFQNVRFDEHDRIRELMAQLRASREQSITGRGHSLAMSTASAGMSPSAALRHRLSGLGGIHYLKSLDDTLDDASAIKQLADKMAELHSMIQASPGQFLLIGETDSLVDQQTDCNNLWDDKATDGVKPLSLANIRKQVNELWITSTSVNFCAKAYPTVSGEHPDSAALSVLGGFLRNGFLHRVIREQGGAYGGGASSNSESACFQFYS
ncbi:MAG: peptidase M16, partial [Gammaproteobacteria bacterium]|nr:peptidase M16 [Gammaproteobacteria bacterium]